MALSEITNLGNAPQWEELSRALNTAFVSTQVDAPNKDYSLELRNLTESPAFKAILSAVRSLAQTQGMTEPMAAELIVSTVRRLDHVWRDYLVREGMERLRGGGT